MSLFKTKTAKLVAGFVGLAMVFAFVAAPTNASAQTIEELQAQIQQLLALIQQLQGGGSSSSGHTYTVDLTVGSTGADVTALQQFLVSKGFLSMPAGAAYGYFGNLTKAGLASYQASVGISPAVGYFGPVTRTHFNAMNTGGDDNDDGDNNDDGGSSDLEGSAGSVSEYKKSSKYANEEVGEGESDVKVVALEIEADDNSDLEIMALKLDLAQGTADVDFDKYAESVSVWFDGKKYAEMDADEFTDDNGYAKTVSLNKGVIVRAGERITVTVAVTGISNLDSGQSTETWTIDITSVRWRDAQGTVISEDPTIAVTTFSFETFATATNVEFKILGNSRDDLNLGHLIDVDATAATDNVEVFSFDVQIKGDSDVRLDDISVEATVTGAANIDEMVDQLYLYVDGDKVDSVNVPANEDTITFDDLDLDLEAGNTYEFVVAVDFLALSGDLDEGDTLYFTISETETDLGTAFFDAKDENGDQLADADKTGTVTSTASATYDSGLVLEFVSASAINYPDGAGGSDDDYAIFEMIIDITAFGGTVFVGDTAAGTTVTTGGGASTDALVYRIFDDGTATVQESDVITDSVTFTTGGGVSDSTDNIQINEGATSRVTITVQKTNDGGSDLSGIHYMDLAGVAWATSDTTEYTEYYNYDLSTFKTSSIAMD